jgi:hypothetical protein
VKTGPRILLLDIETFPDVVYTWGLYEANAIEVKEHWYLLSYASKWFGEKGITCRGIDDTGGLKKIGNDDKALMKEIHALLDEADIVVAHNAVKFDVKKINARLIVHGFAPPSPYKVVDTLRAVRQVAAFSSNKLDWLSKQLGIGRKVEHQGFPLWKACAAGDVNAWAKMKTYNIHDVKLLESLYVRLAPFIRQPNAALYNSGEVCVNPACGSKKVHIYPGLYHANTRTYRRFQCKACGKWARATVSEREPKAVVVTT